MSGARARGKNHGMEGAPEYGTWRAMRRRCYDPSRRSFARYGGRGIGVCERWADFLAFYEDMGPRPQGATLDRIDTDGNYEPANCRWATYREQNSNRADTILIAYQGRTQCLTAWAEELGVHPSLLFSRYHLGWSISDILTRPSRGRKGWSQRDSKRRKPAPANRSGPE